MVATCIEHKLSGRRLCIKRKEDLGNAKLVVGEGTIRNVKGLNFNPLIFGGFLMYRIVNRIVTSESRYVSNRSGPNDYNGKCKL